MLAKGKPVRTIQKRCALGWHTLNVSWKLEKTSFTYVGTRGQIMDDRVITVVFLFEQIPVDILTGVDPVSYVPALV